MIDSNGEQDATGRAVRPLVPVVVFPGSNDDRDAQLALETLGWGKTEPGPELPDDVVTGTRARYVEAFEQLTGIDFDAYLADPTVVLG